MIIVRHRVNKIEDVKNIPPEVGVEIDVRAFGDKLILNHNPHEHGDELEEYLKNAGKRFFIFNIKEAGIEDEVIKLAEKYGISDYFLLDVEYPYIYRATKQGMKKIAVRFSEAEPIEFALSHKNQVDWVWVDTNSILPLNKDNFKQLKEAGFKLCLVCPERWARPQDIEKYISYMKEQGIILDAVMTSKDYIESWKKL